MGRAGRWGAVCRARRVGGTDQMEFEIQFTRDGVDVELVQAGIVIRCFAAWEFERSSDK